MKTRFAPKLWLFSALIDMAALFLTGCHSQLSPVVPPVAPVSLQPQAGMQEPGPLRISYDNVAEKAGIRFRHDDCHRGTSTMMEQIGPGCALLDYDGDGWLDLYLVNGRDRYGRGRNRRNALYRNNRDSTFTDVTDQAGVPGTGYGMGVAVGDYDNDGFPDLFLCQYGKNVLYHNNGDGTFTDVTAKAGVGGTDLRGEPFHIAAAWLDYDRDGRLDLLVTRYVNFEKGPRTCVEQSTGVRHGCPPTDYEPTHCILYHNEGAGAFRDVSRKAGVWLPNGKSLSVTVGDYDDDGWPDLFIANDSTPSYLLHNHRDGTFQEVGFSAGVALADNGEPMAAMGVDFGDYRNTGRLSLFVSDYQDRPNHLFDNRGDGSFVEVSTPAGIGPPAVAFLGFGGGFLDYDNDGWLDLFVANGHVVPEIAQTSVGARGVRYRQTCQLFRNLRDGAFAEVTRQAGPAFRERRAGRGAVWGDLWNRGVEDIVVVGNGETPLLMRHPGTPGRHFLSLRLVGTQSNRDAIGARVYVMADGVRQMQEVKTSRSFLCSGDLRLHFGLGLATTVEKIEVVWPRGRRDVVTGLAADRFYRWKEEESVPVPQTLEPIHERIVVTSGQNREK